MGSHPWPNVVFFVALMWSCLPASVEDHSYNTLFIGLKKDEKEENENESPLNK